MNFINKLKCFFNIKKKKRTIFIGDVHGCFVELKKLWRKLNITKKDTVYFVGDLINKGPSSFEVLQFVYKKKAQVVVGNHEVHFLTHSKKYYHIKLFKELRKKLDANPHIMQWLSECPLYIEKENFILLHAGTFPNKTLKQLSKKEITTVREIDHKPWHAYYKDDKKIIYGHWARQGLHITKNTIGLDSGCVYGGALTAYILEEDKYIQQKAMAMYSKV